MTPAGCKDAAARHNRCVNAPAKLLRLIKVGDSTGVVLPRDVLVKLGVELGDELDVVETPEGLQLRRHDSGFAEQMEVARAVMKRRRDALCELAK